MIYGSVCSGIEAATVAWHPLGWKPAFFSEIEAFPRAVLKHHYPEVPLHGDFTTIKPGEYEPIDLLVGGTPCQSFSVAGLRGGLDDDRGNLALEYLRLADRLRPRWLVWENVPGVLSSNGGRDFGSILGGMGELGYGVAYRVLDAQFFGVAQRRRRVFVVGYTGDWRRAAAVLFERHSLSGHPAPRREAGQAAPTIPSRSSAGGGLGTDFDCDGGLVRWPAEIAPTLNAAFGDKQGLEDQHALAGAGMFVPGTIFATDGQANAAFAEEVALTLNSTNEQPYIAHAVAFALRGREGGAMPEVGGDQAGALRAASGGSSRDYVAFSFKDSGADASTGVSPTLRSLGAYEANGGSQMAIANTSAVRRLTPIECERLQGFPDGYTNIPWRGKDTAPDGPRYKALGNSMAVPCMAWIGRRIAAVEALQSEQEAA